MSNPTEDFGKEIQKEENLPQNASFVEQILIEGIFFLKDGDADIRKVTRKGVEEILNALHDFTEYEVEHIGRSGICEWIWNEKVNKTILLHPLREVLRRKMNVEPGYFLMLYKGALEIQQLLVNSKKTADVKKELTINADSIISIQSDIKSPLQKQLIREICKMYFPEIKFQFATTQRISQAIRGHPLMDKYNKYLIKEAIAETTINKYLSDIRQTCLWLINNIAVFTQTAFDEIQFRFVTQDHLSDYRKFLLLQVKRGLLSLNTVSEKIYNIKLFFRFLTKSGHILQANNPARRLKSVKAKRYRHRDIPSDEEINRLFQVTATYSDFPLLERVAFLLMLCLGLRAFEVSILKWENINFGTRTITFRGKGGRVDAFPIPKKLYESLLKFKESTVNPNGPMFASNEKRFQEELLNNYRLYSMIADWNFPGGVHLFRHTYITKLAKKKKVLPQLVKMLSRHVKLDTTGFYFHTSDDDLKHAINKLKYS